MSGKPKNEIMTPDEMRIAESRAGRLYSQTSDHGMVVTAIVNNLAAELANMPQKIDLRDTQRVADVIVAYTDACARAGTMPNKTGACRAMGLTRAGVDWFIRHHPDEPSADYLTLVFDSYAEALSASSLAGATHPIVGIFLLKSISGYRDTVSIEAPPDRDPLGDRANVSSIIAKYQNDLGGLPD